ncbi:DUF4249 family protein [Flavobacterium eburneipallidum]|uniref:DUF4249 family protein n=1 Tax=Flavobacterium eburneipallidum TaxID=3003263 RepID=UPI002483239B|nr:DUF4249 family protein [Flavobacterium eburneipallidum]
MKNIKLFITILIASLSTTSCEEVVDVDLNTADPKLVIDASIKWEKGSNGRIQKIKLTTTTDFYTDIIPAATGATVTVTNTTSSTPISYLFIENGQTGEYVCSNFAPVLNNDYTLTVAYKGQTYTSTSKLMATPIIEKTEQSIKPGFDGKDVYEIKFYFKDNANETNFYLVAAKSGKIAFPEYGVLSDEFFQGNLMFAIYQGEDLKTGDIIDYSVQGITEKYNNYMNKLISIAGDNRNGPFAVPQAAAIRGNIINTTNPDDFPLGYFHLSEIDSDSYTIK